MNKRVLKKIDMVESGYVDSNKYQITKNVELTSINKM
jgi:uncharacterized protein YfkK (UPF0435 family)